MLPTAALSACRLRNSGIGALGRHRQRVGDHGAVTEQPAADPQLWSEFHALCDLGGRLAGSPSEAAALAWARERLAAIPGGGVQEHAVAYPGWHCRGAQLIDARSGQALRCTPLLGTA